MKRIGITQRVVFQEKVKERRDTLDQNWYAFAAEVGIELIPIPNVLLKPDEYANRLELDGLIFSGGNNVSENESDRTESLIIKDVAVERDKTEAKLLNWAMANKKAVIGICRGMQFIHTNFGGVLIEVDPSIHVAKEHKVSFLEEPFKSIYGENRLCNSYHGKGIPVDNFPAEIKVAGIFRHEVEAISHQSLSIFGVMWHPERYVPFRKEDVHIFTKIFKTD